MSAPDAGRPELSAEDRAMHDELNRTTSTLHLAVLPDAWRADADAFTLALPEVMAGALLLRPGRLNAPIYAALAFTVGRVHGLTRADAEAMARAAIDFAYID